VRKNRCKAGQRVTPGWQAGVTDGNGELGACAVHSPPSPRPLASNNVTFVTNVTNQYHQHPKCLQANTGNVAVVGQKERNGAALLRPPYQPFIMTDTVTP
jgi:hypothetical protein